MKDVAILTPSFSKPMDCLDHIESIRKTTDRAEVFISASWEDKPENIEVYREIPNIHIGPQRCFGPAVNALWRAHPGYKYYMWGADDWFATQQGWLDVLIDSLNKYPDGIVVGWPDDQCPAGLPSRQLARFPITTSKFLETLGYFCLPSLIHWYCDDVITNLAYSISRAEYVEKSKTEHRQKIAPMPPGWGPAIDAAAYGEWLEKRREKDIERLRKEMYV